MDRIDNYNFSERGEQENVIKMCIGGGGMGSEGRQGDKEKFNCSV